MKYSKKTFKLAIIDVISIEVASNSYNNKIIKTKQEWSGFRQFTQLFLNKGIHKKILFKYYEFTTWTNFLFIKILWTEHTRKLPDTMMVITRYKFIFQAFILIAICLPPRMKEALQVKSDIWNVLFLYW